MYRKLEPTPKATHSSSGAILLNKETASTTTTVSTVRMVTFSYPFCTASAPCRSKRVSASSYKHGASWAKYDSAGEQRTPLPSVAYISLPSGKGRRIASRNRKANNSVLFSLTRRKSFQFFGITVEGATLFLISFPLFSLVESFRLAGRYTSQTRSMRLLFSS